MPIRHGCLLAAALLALVLPTAVCNARAGDSKEKEGDHQIKIISSPSILRAGMQCEVELNPETNDRKEVAETTYQGKIIAANDDGIMLKVTSKRRQVRYGGAASHGLIGNRLFRNIGIGTPKPGKEKDVWIPAKTIRTVNLTR